MLPSGWQVQSVLELGRYDPNTVQTGPFGSQLHAEDYVDEGIPLLLIRNIGENGLVLDGLPRISEQDAARLARYALKPGDVVFSRVGRVGSCFLATEEQNGWIISGQTLRIRLPYDELNPQYFLYALRDKEAQDFITGASVGTTRSSINTSILKTLPVRVPSYPEQIAIADILTTVDRAIEQTEALIAKQRRIKAGLLHDLLTRGIDEHGRLRDPSTHRFKSSPVGLVPEEWEVKLIRTFAEVVRGASPRPKGDPRYYGGSVPRLMVEDITRDGKFVTPRVDFLTYAGAKLSRPMQAGSLILVCSGSVGVPAILTVDACIHDGLLGFPLIEETVMVEYLYYFFLYNRNLFDSSATHGGIFTNLTTDIVKQFAVALPSRSEQEGLIDIMRQVDMLLDSTNDDLEKLQHLKTGLMQDLLTGRVSVEGLIK